MSQNGEVNASLIPGKLPKMSSFDRLFLNLSVYSVKIFGAFELSGKTQKLIPTRGKGYNETVFTK
ncbi:hypothetical protein CI610_02378 [invertebrate metagenome]|uniref:Uncharacterized protein n=1 Tax=invertebrate metagenome TaxID=1711999 RepID=A0A2H9T635_9ZZZZ